MPKEQVTFYMNPEVMAFVRARATGEKRRIDLLNVKPVSVSRDDLNHPLLSANVLDCTGEPGD